MSDETKPKRFNRAFQLQQDIAAIEARHAEAIKQLRDEIAAQATESAIQAEIVWQRDTEIEKLNAKIATMVCGTCKGSMFVPWRDGAEKSCPVCQPKEGT